ncbi:hypothetical protein AG1IA_09091 [Rhizoctonia solani AG-1 IA]|uniref:Fungal zn(2)-Cys(6) binuclear cluster domain-containing protein n=1 Tax=Thanatephorus cucumeris (strain AG1-IA) TaxID=983506 RepID=L8WFD0_THACA|nr:hypothetical protein AG1IA_09091 [Rhizoctonia solani AG-1 IA]
MVFGCALGYSLLRRAFTSGQLLVFFPQTLGIRDLELELFVMYDTPTALVLGLAPLVKYACNGECDPTSHGFQSVHGVPIPLVEIILQVSSWRAGFIVAQNDWQILESCVMRWQAPRLLTREKCTRINTEMFAVQEGQRYMKLVDIYMVCRILSAALELAQIIQLGESATGPWAGLGTRQEYQRSIIREKLRSMEGRRVWLFRGWEFGRVLDHLWQGAGAGGAPITWGDYIQSKCAVLPL